MKKFLAALLTVGLLLQSMVGGVMPVQAAQTDDDASKYVTLDGEWHYKMYRKYPNMYQYFPYFGVKIQWEDNELAKLPSASVWQTWESVQMPADNAETGGLLANSRPVEVEAVDIEETEAEETEAEVEETEESAEAESESVETESESVEAESESVEAESEAAEAESESVEAESESEETEGESVEAEATISANAVQVLNDAAQAAADDGYDESWLCPTWSEAWVCRSFTLPADFTTEDTVTLLMGIIDDNDVIYINGQVVAASGFVDGNGNATLNIPETGGFDYTAANAEDKVKWSKSYWEIEREYEIPTSVLNLGGTNEICIRLYNNNSNGGFYSGKTYALCGNETAVRALKGLPTEKTESEEVNEAVQAQIDALKAGDIDAYAATISENYHNDADVKADKVAEVQAMMDAYSDITVTDTNPSVYIDDEGAYWYSANRVITGVNKETGAEETISSSVVEIYYVVDDEGALERGNWNRCYGTSYDSELFGQELTYSVYLPPSYYEDTERSYPVVWLLHGRASSSTSYRDVDGIGGFMDAQIESGNIEEMILIMPDSGKYAFYSDTELVAGDIDNSGPWRTQLTSELRAETQSIYRMLTDAKFNGLTGNSMGGYGSAIIGATYPDLYSSIAVHMGYLPTEAQDAIKSLTAEQLEAYDFYFDAGLQDTTVGYANTVAIHEYLESVGKEHGYDLRDGIHGSAFYMAGMPASMKMHSDHFLKNGLYDAVVNTTEGTFDKNESSADHAALTISVDLNGNVVKFIDGIDSEYYEVTEDGIVLSKTWLSTLTEDTVLTINLFSGKSFTYTVKVTETPAQTEAPDDTDDTQKPDDTDDTKKPADTSKPNKPSKPSHDSVQTGDTFNLQLVVGIFIGSMLVAAALLMVLMRRRKSAR